VHFEVLGVARSEEQARKLQSFVTKHDLEECVHLHGLMTGDAKRSMFAAADVFFTPTHQDAFPVTVLEAMSAGLPVVAARVGGLPVMLEEGSGARFATIGDVGAMTNHLCELLDDAWLRHRMGTANRERFVGRYHPDRVGAMAVDLYRSLAAHDRVDLG
jgi:glycosyltransferase involved in cell wall biosynthesis